jgi:hypothetical protein
MGEHETDARDKKERGMTAISPLEALERSFCKPFETLNEVQL